MSPERSRPRAVAGAFVQRGEVRPYWKMLKFPSSHHSRMNTRMVVKHPPPSFLAPQPAATPRNSLLIFSCLLSPPKRERSRFCKGGAEARGLLHPGTMRTRTSPAPAATIEPIRSTRKALAELVEAGRFDEARPLARFVLQEVAALGRAGFTRPVRAGDL